MSFKTTVYDKVISCPNLGNADCIFRIEMQSTQQPAAYTIISPNSEKNPHGSAAPGLAIYINQIFPHYTTVA
jgi:hypothetical protein